MSWYYSYYCGYRNLATNKIYPLGPFDVFGNLNPIFSRSRSFASDLHEDFCTVREGDYTDSLKKSFNIEDDANYDIWWLPLSDLPDGDPVKRGYFLVDDIKYYEDGGSVYDDIFYDKLTPTEYINKMQNEMQFGYHPEKDEEGGIIGHSCQDYMYYAYLDKSSQDYEAELIRNAFDSYDKYDFKKRNYQFVVLMTQG